MTIELDLAAGTARRLLDEASSISDTSRRLSQCWTEFDRAELLHVAAPEPVGFSSLEAAAAILSVCAQSTCCIPYAETAAICAPMLVRGGLPLRSGPMTAAIATEAQLRQFNGGLLSVRAEVPRVPWARASSLIMVVCPYRDHEVVLCVEPAFVSIGVGVNMANEPRDDILIDTEIPAESWIEVPIGTSRELELRGALSRAIAISSAADRCLELTLRHIRVRTQFGRPIGKFQVVQHAVAQLAAEAAIMRASVDAALAICSAFGFQDNAPEVAIAIAKAQAGRSCEVVARIAHQLHGAIGTTREHTLHQFTTRMWSWRDEFGSDKRWLRSLGEIALMADPWEIMAEIGDRVEDARVLLQQRQRRADVLAAGESGQSSV